MRKVQYQKRAAVIIPLILFAILVGFSLVEIGIRVSAGQVFVFENFVMRFVRSASRVPLIEDPVLGWVPKPNSNEKYFYGIDQRWLNVTTDENGLRISHRTGFAQTDPDILAVGDSFVFGSDVSDTETWPQYLGEIRSTRVLNGGVPGYGFDQIVLRAEALTQTLRPKILIVGLIEADIQRGEYSVYQMPKPFFALEGERIRYNQPRLNWVPIDQLLSNLGWPQRWLGYSLAIHKFMMSVGGLSWLDGAFPTQREHSDGRAVACLLLDRLQSLKSTTRVVLLFQYQSPPNKIQIEPFIELGKCAEDRGIEVLDLKESFVEAAKSTTQASVRLFGRHLTPEGNRFVATKIHHTLNEFSHDK